MYLSMYLRKGTPLINESPNPILDNSIDKGRIVIPDTIIPIVNTEFNVNTKIKNINLDILKVIPKLEEPMIIKPFLLKI